MKLLHSTLRAAYRAAIESSAWHGRPYRVYRCPGGGGWHVTQEGPKGIP